MNEEYEEEEDDEDYPSAKKQEELEEDPIEGDIQYCVQFPMKKNICAKVPNSWMLSKW